MLRGRQAMVYVDNMGSMIWYNKGWAKQCNLGNTVIRAINLITTALHCDFWVEKVPRCSSRETEAADALSKCNYERFLVNMPGAANTMPKVVPKTLLQWMEDPKPDRELGGRILEEMAETTELMGYN